MTALCLALALLPGMQEPNPSDPPRAPRVVELLNRVEGRTVILSLVPEGTSVKKGQVIGELDSAAFRNDLIDQQIAVKLTEAEAQGGRSNREIAESEAKEEAMVVAQEIARLKDRVKLAETGVAVAAARLEEARKTRMATAVTPAEAAKARADRDLKDQRIALKTLQEIAGPKRLQEAENKVAAARGEEAVKTTTLAAEQAKEKKLRLQVERCKLIAPADGMLLYANPADGGAEPPPIEEGATVRERQALVRIVPN